MLQVEWNEYLLQAIGEEAIKRGQIGIIFWCNSNRWHLHHKRISCDKANCKRVEEKLQEGYTAWSDFGKKNLQEIFEEKCDNDGSDENRFAELVVPAKELVADTGYRNWILRILKSKEIQGPVTLFPIVRLSNIHFKSLA